MRLIIDITITCDGETKSLAHESVYVKEVSPARRYLARHVASVAAQILSGEKIVTKELPEHFKD